jgi:hypothetical protein
MFNTISPKIIIGAALVAASMSGEVVYSSMPSPLPPNVPSLGYESASTSEFGNAINLTTGSSRLLNTISVVMSNWARESTYETVVMSAGYNHNLTLNLYNTVPASTAVGSQFATLTVNAFIPWRPEASPACTVDNAYLSGGNCCHGIASNVTFDFSSLAVILPDSLIFGLAYNTADYGASPIHATGPYNSLNFGTYGGPAIGSNVYTDAAYLNSSSAAAYGNDPDQTTGSFRFNNPSGADSPNGYSPGISIDAVPEPATFVLFATGLLAVAGVAKRRKA